MNEVLEWAERNGLENLRSHIECSSIIAREAAVTLGWLATVAGASLAFISNSNWSPIALQVKFGLAALALFLLVLSVYLVFRCLRITDKPSPTDEPANMMDLSYTLDQHREAGLLKMQERIRDAVAQNVRTSNALNRVRVAGVLGLVLAAIAASVVLGSHVFAAKAEVSTGVPVSAEVSGLTSEVSSDSGQK